MHHQEPHSRSSDQRADVDGILRDLVSADRTSLIGLLEARSRLTPDLLFMSWRETGQELTWTYADAWKSVLGAAAALRARGVTRGDRVCSFMSNSPAAVWAWLGTHACGGVYVPINRQYRGTLLADQVSRSGAVLMLADAAAEEELADAHVSLPLFGTADLTRASDGWRRETNENPPEEFVVPEPGEIGTILFTSGSTGRSKAALLPHNQIPRAAAACVAAFRMTSSDVIHGWLPLFHIAGQMNVFGEAIVAGAEVALYPAFSASRLWNQVRASNATKIIGFPVIAHILLDMPASSSDRDHSVRIALIGGADEDTHRRVRDRFGFDLMSVYGMTEAEAVLLPALDDNPEGSCGRPGPDFEVVLLDESDRPVPQGAVGEICVRPLVEDVMFRGYEGDDAATVARWRNLWFHTGDLARTDGAGHHYFLGRRGDRIRRRGENVSAAEAESILLMHPSVDEACVVGVPSEVGEEDVKATVAPKRGTHVTAATLRAWCEQNMPRFMVPRFVEIVDALPRLPVGKVDRRSLRTISPDTVDFDERLRQP